MKRSRRFWASAFLLLPFLVYTGVVIFPLATSFYYSFTDWNGFDADYNYVGAKNFERIYRDPLFENAIKNTIKWTIAAIVIPTVSGLVLALAMHGRGLLAKIYKSLFYLPVCLSLVVIGQVWIWIYQPRWGLLNEFLEYVHLDEYATAWLADPDTALGAVIAAWAWKQTALAMVVFLAGLTAIPPELIEAAKIDGANYFQYVRRVIIPLLAPATVVVIALAVISSLKSFDTVYTMTRGGPFNSSDNLAMFMYNESFWKYRMGYGSAIAVVLFLITMVVIAFYFRQVRNLEQLYD
jgi:ABC-type sugar transport system permease subunit